MSTTRSSSGGKKASAKRKLGTPGRAGVEFEATVRTTGNGDGARTYTPVIVGQTFSYEEVSNIATVTPASKQGRRGRASKAVAKASSKSQRQAEGKEKPGVGEKRAESARHRRTPGTEVEGRAEKRRKQRRREKEAATEEEAETESSPTKTKDTTVTRSANTTPSERRTTPSTRRATPPAAANTTPSTRSATRAATNATTAATSRIAAAAAAATTITTATVEEEQPSGRRGAGDKNSANKTKPNGSVGARSSSSDDALRKGKGVGDEREGGVAEGGDGNTTATAVAGEKRKRAKGQGDGREQRQRERKRRGDGGGRSKRHARKVPRYPKLPFTAAGEVTTFAEALVGAVGAEVQGLIRKRGDEPLCKAAVHACVELGKEIRRQAFDIGEGLRTSESLDLVALREEVVKLKRAGADIDAELELWSAEERKCLALAQKNDRAQAKLDGFEGLAAGESLASPGIDGKRPLVELEGEEEEKSNVPSEGLGTAKRVSDELLVSIDHMILDATAIGRCLQEMGAGVADAQEARDRLVRVFRQQTFKNYPNIDNPKAGILRMLRGAAVTLSSSR